MVLSKVNHRNRSRTVRQARRGRLSARNYHRDYRANHARHVIHALRRSTTSNHGKGLRSRQCPSMRRLANRITARAAINELNFRSIGLTMRVSMARRNQRPLQRSHDGNYSNRSPPWHGSTRRVRRGIRCDERGRRPRQNLTITRHASSTKRWVVRRHAQRASGNGRRVRMDPFGSVLQYTRKARSGSTGRANSGNCHSQRRYHRLRASQCVTPRHRVVTNSRLLYRQGTRASTAPITRPWGRGSSQHANACEDRHVSARRLSSGDHVRRQVHLLRGITRRR